MLVFTVETHYAEDREKLTDARPRHREYLRGLVEEGAAASRTVREWKVVVGSVGPA